MALGSFSLPLFPSPRPISTLRSPLLSPPLRFRLPLTTAIGPDGKFYPTPSDDDPPEAPEDSMHGVSKFQQIHRQAARARKQQEERAKNEQSIFLNAIADVEDSPDDPLVDDGQDDFFGEIDKAIALKRKEFVKQGLLKPNPKKATPPELEVIDELDPEEVIDMDEIRELTGLTEISAGGAESQEQSTQNKVKGEFSDLSSFHIDFDNISKTRPRIVEPTFRMSLAELLDESKIVPISVYGDIDVEVTGVQHDSRLVESGDLYVCCTGRTEKADDDMHVYLSEASKRGASAIVASKEVVDVGHNKALVIVDDTDAALPILSAIFYRHPSKNMSVIGITGSNGKTATSYLIKSLYEAMGLRTGMLSSVAYYIHGDNKMEDIEPPIATSDSHLVQKLMAKMLHNGTETLVMDASGSCDELVDFDIAVFTNLTQDHLDDFHNEDDDDEELKHRRNAIAELFTRMVDPERHRKVVNIDDPNAAFFISQGNLSVPVVTFAVENKKADVHPLKFELSLFETTVLVNTPKGILEISSGLLGRRSVYSILAAVAVGVAVGAPLEDIVKGVEEVDVVPGRCELIDEEQAYGVIVDHAHTPRSLSTLLDYVRELSPRRIITVFGCAGESDRGKRPMMTKIATDKSDITILTSDNPKNEDPLDILDDMLAGVGWSMQDYLKYGENDYYPPLPNGHRLFLHDIRSVAVRCAVAMGEDGDMVVVAGKGHETYQVEGDKKEFFDDREECREALQYVAELHQAGIDTSEFPWRLPESH
ncbi:unnamed protein product [Cuscuta epithymum]|uniref:UDP-N-acetylmuramoyl-L-alanyl-D-glutamate--2,6-diaminopimelate ligase MurE homolog, chloroplastic n=1 Tax=Cuscuta epithymum TaxID=186058 RepID=A0AAV0FP28_9ASTE|nr:unnamed protein product [Cuscuta epithymum]